MSLDFHAERPAIQRLKLSDGTTMEVRFEIGSLTRVGFDPSTGFPQYQLSFQAFSRVIDAPSRKRRESDTDRMAR